jgi:hypothetical protein
MTIVVSNTVNMTPESVLQQNEENVKIATHSDPTAVLTSVSHPVPSYHEKRQALPQPLLAGAPGQTYSRVPRGLPRRPLPTPPKPHANLHGVVAGGCVVSEPSWIPLPRIRKGGCWGNWRLPQLPPRLAPPPICMPRLPRFRCFPRIPHRLRLPRFPRFPRFPRLPRFPQFPGCSIPRGDRIRPAIYERIMRPEQHRVDPRFDGRIR